MDNRLISMGTTPPAEATAEARDAEARDPLGPVAKRMYSTPAALPANEFYPIENVLEPVFVNREADALKIVGMTKDEYQREAQEYAAVLRETGIKDVRLGRRLWDLKVDEAVRAARRQPELTEEERHAFAVEAREELRGLYRDDTDALIARLNKFLEQYPKLKALMDVHGAGARRDVVGPLIEHVRGINFR